jgi:large subunit ribosomal protein L18
MSRYRLRDKIKKISNDRPILMVEKTNKHLRAQLIDRESGKVIAQANDNQIKSKEELGKKIGKMIAEKAKTEGVKEVVFDRSPYPYKGKIKDIAEGAREGGLKF